MAVRAVLDTQVVLRGLLGARTSACTMLAVASGTTGEVVLEISADNVPGNCGPGPPPSGLLIDDIRVE